jgi:hypothetical protein
LPHRQENAEILLSEIEAVLSGLAARDLKVVPLSFLTGKEIMIPGSEIQRKDSKNSN